MDNRNIILIFAQHKHNIMRTSKNKLNCEMGNNLTMSDEVFTLRREVIGYIYEAKNLLKGIGIHMPRVEIRITDNNGERGEAIGMGRMGGNIIWISTNCLNKWNKHVREVVFHELLHAVLGIKHDEKCPLMRSRLEMKPLCNKVVDENFLKYFKK